MAGAPVSVFRAGGVDHTQHCAADIETKDVPDRLVLISGGQHVAGLEGSLAQGFKKHA